MPKDYTQQPRTQMRRSDRAIEDEGWIREFLQRAPMAVIATAHDGQPFINSNLFVYDEAAHAIYMHTAKVGRTRANIDAGGANGQDVCFSISEMGRLLPAKEALEFSVEYAGVTVFGTAMVVENDEAATHALQMLLDKYCPHLKPGRDYRPIVTEELRRTSVYRIDIQEWSGKRKVVEEDFPGAFFYGQHSSA